MFRRLNVLALSTIIGLCVSPPLHAEEGVARRNAYPGMTIRELGEAPHPDGEPAQLICSSHLDSRRKTSKKFKAYEMPALRLSHAWVDRGLDKCHYARWNSDMKEWSLAGVALNGLPVATEYMFFPDDDGTKRLVLVTTNAPAGMFAVIADAHVNKYGPYAKAESEVVQNGVGNTFDMGVYTWNIGKDDIIMKQYAETLQKMVIYYVDRERYERFLREQQKFLAANQAPM